MELFISKLLVLAIWGGECSAECVNHGKQEVEAESPPGGL
jgi:hypothetical protein